MAATSNNNPALLKAVTAGRPRQVRLLLDSSNNPAVDMTDDCGQTPLIRALFLEHARNRERIVKMLLKHGARIGTPDVAGRTVLSWACLYGRDKELGWLLQHQDTSNNDIVNQADLSGQTPLFHAVTAGNAACTKLMCDAVQKLGYSLETPNHSGVTPLMQALKHGHDVCASILIRQGGASLSPEILDKYKKFSTRTKGKWAQKCNPQTGSDNTELPPIIPASCIPKIQYRENRARQSTFVTPLDSDDDSTYESSGLGMSSNTSSSSGSAYTGGRLTTMSFISTSSTEVNADSDEDAEMDAYAMPIHDDDGITADPEDSGPEHLPQASASSHRPKAAKLKSRARRTDARSSHDQSPEYTDSESSDESDDDDEESDDSGSNSPNSK